MELLKKMIRNYQTTLPGLGLILVSVGSLFTGDASLIQTFERVGALLAGMGFIAAKDAGTGSSP